MFEPGAYSLLNRCGTFVYKGAVFAAVGFAAVLKTEALQMTEAAALKMTEEKQG